MKCNRYIVLSGIIVSLIKFVLFFVYILPYLQSIQMYSFDKIFHVTFICLLGISCVTDLYMFPITSRDQSLCIPLIIIIIYISLFLLCWCLLNSHLFDFMSCLLMSLYAITIIRTIIIECI